MNRVYIVLGSNIGKERNLRRAARLLSALCSVKAYSPVYETVPVGLLDQPNFLNAAALVETELNLTQVKLQLLEVVEKKLKRVRTADKNAPRTIDVDIILYNDAVLEYELPDGRHGQVPDPDLLRFPHVAIPIADLAPDMLHPVTGETLSGIAQRLMESPDQWSDGPSLWLRPDIVLH